MLPLSRLFDWEMGLYRKWGWNDLAAGWEGRKSWWIPKADRIHRLLHLWAAGDVQKVDAYLDDNALRQNELFRRVLQAIIELLEKGSEERALLESISNHVQGKGAVAKNAQSRLSFTTESMENRREITVGITVLLRGSHFFLNLQVS